MKNIDRSFLFLALGALLAFGCGPSSGGNGDDDGGVGTPDGGPETTDDDHDGYSEVEGDCNDNDPSIHPGANEVCDDNIDNNCNGDTDAADYQCLPPCDKAAADRSSVGCVYYAVDTNAMGGPYAVAVSNIDPDVTANVVVEQKTGATWGPVTGGSFTVGPRSLYTLNLTHRYTSGSAIYAGGAYRITSDLPVIAYQFAPIDGSASYLSDASLLLPVSALDKHYIVPAWPYGPADLSASSGWPAHIQIAAADAVTVTVTSPIVTQAGSGVPALSPGVSQDFTLEEGDYLQLTSQNFLDSFSGSQVEASGPVAVFSSNDCANVPATGTDCCCEHLEEQIFGLQTWGTSYVAAQMPRRQTEGSVWQITAQQNGTTLTFAGDGSLTGLPGATATLDANQQVQYEISGGGARADFLVTSDKPIHVNQYTVGCYHVQNGSTLGDPDMVQAIPTEQYLSHYVILVPGTWINDFLILVRKAGSTVLIDGNPPTETWSPVGSTGWETASVLVADGVHVLDGNMAFGVAVSGYDDFDSYSYPGGLNQTVINPIP